MTVRRATVDDADGLSRLAATTFPLACTPRTPPEVLADHEPGADPVGYAMLVPGEPTDPGVARALTTRPTIALERFYVHPRHHGTGVADALMGATLEQARRTAARGVWLGVSEENGRANAFYARHGFAQVGRKRFAIGETWEDDHVRERLL